MGKVKNSEVIDLRMTSRSKRIRQRMLDSDPTISSERAVLFTEYVKEHWSEPAMTRLAGGFTHVLDNMTIRIEPEELIVGNLGPTPRSCQIFPEYSWKWINDGTDLISIQLAKFSSIFIIITCRSTSRKETECSKLEQELVDSQLN